MIRVKIDERNLHQIRSMLGIRQYELAKVIGLTPSFLCLVEKGAARLKNEHREKIETYLNKKVDDINDME